MIILMVKQNHHQKKIPIPRFDVFDGNFVTQSVRGRYSETHCHPQLLKKNYSKILQVRFDLPRSHQPRFLGTGPTGFPGAKESFIK